MSLRTEAPPKVRADRSRAVDVEDLTVKYGSFTAVDQVSLHVRPHEILGLLGPNGAGKTSVIRALTTIIPLAGGSATIAGHDIRDATAVRARIGVLPESNGYPNSLTARQYLRFYGQLFGLDADESAERAERLLHQLGISRKRGRIATFSRGMRQRLGLCRALINDPEVLFLDEPTLGLDPTGKDELLQYLSENAARAGTAVVLCSHLLDEVERVCDRVAIMSRGRIVSSGTVDEVVAMSGESGRSDGRHGGRLSDAFLSLTADEHDRVERPEMAS